jgi:DNA-binding transcriptional LysR family regulator
MNPEKLWNIDLNLLVMLSVLLEEQSVTRTAERLHLTPSAVSHALKRLRDLFQDELLVRDGRRMLATVRAQQLAEILPRALGQLANTLAAPEVFAPASSTRTFRLAAPDFIAPHVLREVGASAPHVRVEFLPSSPTAVVDLTQNHYDALVAPRSFKNEGLRGIIPYFSMAAAIIAQTDLLVTLPSIIMRRDVEFYEFESRSAPFDIPPMGLSLFRSATRGDESGIKWFLNQITTACRSL